MSIIAKYFGANTWKISFDDLNVLIDPWIKGDLVFDPGPWLLKGELLEEQTLPKDIDLILLTQGLPDHAHKETLRLFQKTIPVIASLEASKIVSDLHFKTIKTLSPYMKINILGLQISATKGARVPKLENGYILEYKHHKIYIEPHGYYDKTIKEQSIDIVITPIKDLGIPIFGNFIKGRTAVKELVKRFKPRYILTSTTGGKIKFSGILNNFIKQHGTDDEIRQNLPDNIELISSEPGNSYSFNFD